MENINNLKITSIEELKEAMDGEIVELPAFDNAHRFIARLRRPSMLGMVESGNIPNSLLVQANGLFVSGASTMVSNKMDENMMKDMRVIMEAICEQSFVEPTYKQLKENGIKLTDEQYMFIFNYSQRGVKALENFR